MPPGYDNFFKTGSLSFNEVLSAAVADLTENGFDDLARVQGWIQRIRDAASRSLIPERVLEENLRNAFRAQFRRLIDMGGIQRYHPGVPLFTLEKVKPKLRNELDRRLMAARDLIKLNRQRAVEEVTQRFAGWATSIPAGGSETTNRTETKARIRRSMSNMSFVERRLHIDQGHKFLSNLSAIIAVDGGALAGIWHSHADQVGYNYREEHKEIDGDVFVIRGNWALTQGLMKLNGHKYTDDIEAPGQLVYCRCFYRYIYSLRGLPAGMVTEKGRTELARARALVSA